MLTTIYLNKILKLFFYVTITVTILYASVCFELS